MSRFRIGCCAVALVLCLFSTLRADELRADDDDQELKQILTRWQQKRTSVERVYVEFMLFEYDTVFKVEKRGEGRAYIGSPEDFWWAIEPTTITDAQSKKKDRHGKAFKLENAARALWVHRKLEEGSELLRSNGETFERIPVSDAGLFRFSPAWFASALASQHGLIVQHSTAPANDDFQWKLVKKTATEVYLAGKPRPARFAQILKSVTFILDAQTLQPKAARLIGPTGNSETVYAFSEYRTNDDVTRVESKAPLLDYEAASAVIKQASGTRPERMLLEPKRLFAPKTIARLRKEAASKDPALRLTALKQLRPALDDAQYADLAVPLLLDEDARIRSLVADHLSNLNSHNVQRAVEFARHVLDENASPRALLQPIERVTPQTPHAGSLLDALFAHTDSNVRDEIVHALARLKRTDPAARRFLLDALIDENVYVAESAREVIDALDWPNDDKSIVPTLIDELTGSEPADRLLALRCLAKLGPSAQSARPQVEILIDDNDPATRLSALTALLRIGGDAQSLVGPTLALLEAENATVRLGAARLLGDIGNAADSATPQLGLLISDSDARVAAAAVDAIKRIEKERLRVAGAR